MIESTKFRNKITGEIATQIPIMEMNDWEKVGEEKPDKKLPPRVQLYNEMWMRNNGDIIYVDKNGFEAEPFSFNLKKSAPKQFKKIVDSFGTKDGKKVREQTFMGIASLMEKEGY